MNVEFVSGHRVILLGCVLRAVRSNNQSEMQMRNEAIGSYKRFVSPQLVTICERDKVHKIMHETNQAGEL